NKPTSIMLCGERVMLMRDTDGTVRGLRDRCAHRGLPLSRGRQEFPGTITCMYHGWTYNLENGCLLAALTDGPDSPTVDSTVPSVFSYRVAEANGLVWVYMGKNTDVELADQAPSELLEPGILLMGRAAELPGDWRHAAEGGFDEGHAKYLHRRSLWKLFRYLPSWTTAEIE